MKVMTFNVGIGTRNRKKSDKFYGKDRMKAMKTMLSKQKPDIICFQELGYPANKYIPKEYRKVLFTGGEHPIYVLKNVKIRKRRFSIFGSMIELDNTYIFSIHGNGKTSLIDKICKSLQFIFNRNKPIVMCGDGNTSVENIKERLPLLQNARELIEKPKQNTYIHFYDNNRCGELDYFMTYNIHPKNYYMISDRISDHFPVIMEI